MAARKTQTAKKTTRKLAPAKKRATAKRAPAKKATAKKAPARKAAKAVKRSAPAKKSAVKLSIVKTGPISVGKKPFTKSQLLSTISEQTGIARKEVDMVINSVSKVIAAHLKKQGPESFSLPGLFKIVVVKKPATPERWGVNPFTGEKMKFKAKPASRRVKMRPLKGLKEMAM